MKTKLIPGSLLAVLALPALYLMGLDKPVSEKTKSGPKPFIYEDKLEWEPAGENVRRQVTGWNEQSMLVKVEFLSENV